MSQRMRQRTVVSLFTLCLTACAGRDGETETVDQVREEIINGWEAGDPELTGFARLKTPTEQGSGVLLTNNWLLTAAHVVDYPTVSNYTVSLGTQQFGALRKIVHPNAGPLPNDVDVALVRTSGSFLANSTFFNFRRAVSNLPLASMMGGLVSCYGYGRYTVSGDAGTLRWAGPYTVGSSSRSGYFDVSINFLGQIPYYGDSGGPCIDPLTGEVWGVMVGFNSTQSPPSFFNVLAAETIRSWVRRNMYESGDIAGDNGIGDFRSDIALTGVYGWQTIPVARANGDFSFTVTNANVAGFPTLAAQAGAVPVPGDFNGDGQGDIALTGVLGWQTVPIALSNGNGSFNVTNPPAATFASLASTNGAKPVAGDFNGDGKGDIALTGVFGWASVPIAFSNGTGFTLKNEPVTNFGSWASTPGAKPVAGDFNGDGKDDIALTGVAGWATVPVAFSKGDGSFDVKNEPIIGFATWASRSGAKPVAGDFNGDGKGDIALVGVAGWGTIPVAFSNGNGTFAVTDNAVSAFPDLSASPGAKPVSGDFNGDGRADIALVGVNGWLTIPIAQSLGQGFFGMTNKSVTNFPAWSAQNGAKPVGAG